jgi:arabinogalactan endo-1,4-beta-galactosidase
MDYNGTHAIDPMEYAGAAGMNVARVSTFMETCSGPTLSFNNSAGWPEREKLYTLDWGCIDLQVSVALRAQSMSMKIVHAINMGQILPLAWSNLTYVEMLAKIAEETERQVRPFLDAGIQADFFILGKSGGAY